MAKFKVGDRILCVNAERRDHTTNGKTYVVNGVDPVNGLVRFVGDDGHQVGRCAWRFELAKDLKLEKGATVRLKDGVDEWVVNYVTGVFADIARPTAAAFRYGVPDHNLVVVKEKPEDPKTDYYINCKGAEPKDGDVFADSYDQVCFIRGDRYHVCGESPATGFPLTGGRLINAVGNARTRRTLVARDGKPYTG